MSARKGTPAPKKRKQAAVVRAVQQQPKAQNTAQPAKWVVITRPMVVLPQPKSGKTVAIATHSLQVSRKVRVDSMEGHSPVGGNREPAGNPAVKKGRMTEGPTGVGLSKCAFLYAKALVNPFGQFEDYPCVPTSPAMMTQKWRSVTRGTFSSFTTGIGFVAVCPQNPGNDQASVYYSTGGAAVTAVSTGAGTLSVLRSSLPYTLASFASNKIQGRLVGLGLRVRNITQALNVGGLLYAIQGTRATDLTGYTVAQIKADPRTVLVPQALSEQTEWSVMVWRPNETSDLDLDGDFTLASTLSMAFIADIPTNTPQTFEWEMVEFWEYAAGGPGLTLPEMTMQHADPVGLARVTEALQTPPNTLQQKEWITDAATGLVDAVAHSDSVAKTVEDLMGFAGMATGMIGPMVSSLVKALAI